VSIFIIAGLSRFGTLFLTPTGRLVGAAEIVSTVDYFSNNIFLISAF